MCKLWRARQKIDKWIQTHRFYLTTFDMCIRGFFPNVYPLTTDEQCTHHATLVACYQFAQSILKLCANKKVGQGEVGECSHYMSCRWWLSWLDVEKPWSALGGFLLSFLAHTGVENAPLPLQQFHFWHCRQFSVRRSSCWSESPDHCVY